MVTYTWVLLAFYLCVFSARVERSGFEAAARECTPDLIVQIPIIGRILGWW